jgi:hypothetical protein
MPFCQIKSQTGIAHKLTSTSTFLQRQQASADTCAEPQFQLELLDVDDQAARSRNVLMDAEGNELA